MRSARGARGVIPPPAEAVGSGYLSSVERDTEQGDEVAGTGREVGAL
jgi:hypothetical protein